MDRASLKEPGVLLVSDDPGISDRVEFILESRFGYFVYRTGSARDAWRVMRMGTPQQIPIRMLIYNLKDGAFPDFEDFQKNFKGITCVFCQNKGEQTLSFGQSSQGNSLVLVERKKLFSDLDSLIGPLLNDTEKEPDLELKLNLDGTKVEEDDVEFCKIRTSLLLGVIPLHADIFIRLSPQKYLKLFKKGDVFELEDLQKYTVQKGIEYFYLRKQEVTDFVNKYSKELQQQAMKEPPVTFPESAKIAEAAAETIQELSKRIGFTPEVQQIAKTQVNLTVRAMGKSPSLRNILEKLQVPGTKYIPAHSMLCPYIACAIASQMEWGSEATFHKLTLASMLHDITLDNHDLAAETTLHLVERSVKYTPAEIKSFRNHAMEGAEIARMFTEVPPDVDVIVAQHHERPDGKGFPRGLTAQYIAPLACLFIVAHDLTQFCLKAIAQGFAPNLKVFITQYSGQYKGLQFKKCLAALESVIASDKFSL